MQFADIIRGRKVCVFLRPELAEAVERAGAGDFAVFVSSQDGALVQNGRAIIRRYRSTADVEQNNAEVLILDRRALLAASSVRFFQQAKFVLVPAGARALPFAKFVLWHLLKGTLAFRGALAVEGVPAHASRWFVLENVYPYARRRTFVPPEHGFRPVFEALRGLNYSVLRWHRLLGDWRKLNDLDIMAHQNDVAEIKRRLDRRLGFFATDVFVPFSESGQRWNGAAYLPPARAIELLERSIEGEFGERRPMPRDTLLSFAYHLLFHKRIRRLGRGDRLKPNTWKSERHYHELMRLADEAGVPRFSTLRDIEDFLKAEGWFPPIEMLKYIAKKNRFVRRRYYNFRHYRPGLTVFALRESAARHGLVGEIESMIANQGFNILRSTPIPEELRYRAMTELRGGNWGSGTGNDRNGGPVHCIIVFDPKPIPYTFLHPQKLLLGQYRDIDNKRVLFKHQIRKSIVARFGDDALDPVHATDNSLEALGYLRVVSPELYETCFKLVALLVG